MIDLSDRPLVSLEDCLLYFRRGSSLPSRKIEYRDTHLFQIVILPYPVVPDNEYIDVQFLHDFRVVEGFLRNHDVRILERLDDGNPLLEGYDRRILVTRHQLIGADPDDEGVAQSAGVLNHFQVIGMEHIECPGSINDNSIVIHNNRLL